jgi:hypothetical protein
MNDPNTSPKSALGAAPEALNSAGDDSNPRRPYCAPRITASGPLERIALGGTPGLADSGTEFIEKPPGS